MEVLAVRFWELSFDRAGTIHRSQQPVRIGTMDDLSQDQLLREKVLRELGEGRRACKGLRGRCRPKMRGSSQSAMQLPRAYLDRLLPS